MPYQRPKPSRALNDEELLNYFNHYSELAKDNVNTLNQKIPRKAFDDLLDRIGCMLLDHAKQQPVSLVTHEFLEKNPLPKSLEGLLPDDFRIYCLALNALKQWLAAEQAATDRYLLGGKARQKCRSVATTCVVTGEPLDAKMELHHPVRDGRPPIPLSKRGHSSLEGQAGSAKNDSILGKILAIKREMSRSWIHLRNGCLDLLGKETKHSTPGVASSSKAFARKVSKETGLTSEQILAWLDLTEIERREKMCLDDDNSIPILAVLRANGLLTDDDWNRIKGFLQQALKQDSSLQELDDGTIVSCPDADPRNADWPKIVSASTLAGCKLPDWAALWLWWLRTDSSQQFWREVGRIAQELA